MSHGGGSNQDFELNLAPIIDCLTVLIAFMLISAAFLSIGILDAGISAGGATQSTDKPPAIQIEITLKEGNLINVGVTGKITRNEPIAPIDGKWNFKKLNESLAALKTQYPDVSAMTLSAQDKVAYRDIVETMSATKTTMPVVLLGGF